MTAPAVHVPASAASAAKPSGQTGMAGAPTADSGLPALSRAYLRRAERLATLVAPVLPGLELAEAQLSLLLSHSHPFIQTLARHTERFRGKRLRPALLMLAGRACGGAESDSEISCKTAALVEMLHLATLCHDDILDDAATRRNVPTVNAEWGNKAAVMAGDLLFSRAFEELGHLNDPRPQRVLSKAAREICEGELLQIASRFQVQTSEAAYLDLIDKKTGALFGAAGELGGLLAGASEAEGARLNRYGRRLGMAFQIVDDCLDLVGVEKTVGKSLGGDLKNGEPTLPLIQLFKVAPAELRQELLKIFQPGSARLTRETLRPWLEAHGTLSYALNFARNEINAARAELEFLPASNYREALREAAEFVLARDS